MAKKKTDSTANNEWYTPRFIIDWVNEFQPNGIDLDPFSCAKANEIVQARRYFTKEMDAFSITDWREKERPIGLIFANIPYLPSSLAQKSVTRLIEEYYGKDTVNEMIILTHNPVDTKMFDLLAWGGIVAFSQGRVSFIDGNTMKLKDNPGSGHILTYFGPYRHEFMDSVIQMTIPKEFSRLRGWVVPNRL